MKHTALRLALASLVCASLGAPARASVSGANESAPVPTLEAELRALESTAPALVQVPVYGEQQWDFKIMPYLWAASLDGDVQLAQLPSAEVDLSFSDILDDLDFTLMFGFEARPKFEDWALLVDFVYLGLKSENKVVETDVDQLMVEFDVALAMETELETDLLLGLRFWNMQIATDFAGGSDRERTRGWVDPVVGARTLIELAENWKLHLRADLGGFGAGSDFSYQGILGARYTWGPSGHVALGYRHMDLDYDHDGFEYDAATSGPVLGVSFGF